MKTRISINVSAARFRSVHADKVMRSDVYYVQLANNVLRVLIRNKSVLESFGPNLPVTMAVRLTAYFEDVVSRIGLFAAFRRIHLRISGRKLPFFAIDDDDYYDDEVNAPDIMFILWCTIQEMLNERERNNDVRFVNPDNSLIVLLGKQIAELLEDEYETAPENAELYEMVHGVDHNDFFRVRELLKWVHYGSYLSMNHPTERLSDEVADLVNNGTDWHKEHFRALGYGMEMSRIFNKSCSPIAVSAIELLREATTEEGLLKTLDEMRYRVIECYVIVESGGEVMKVSPVGKREEVFEVARRSFDANIDAGKGMVLMSALVRFNGLWFANGTVLTGESNRDDDSPLDLDDPDALTKENAAFTYENIMRYTGDNPLVFFRNFNEYADFWTKVFPTFKSFADSRHPLEYAKNGTNLLFFTDPTLGTVLVPDAAKWVKSPDNKLYVEKDAESHALSILVGSTPMPLQLISYLLKNNLLPDAATKNVVATRGKEIVGENQWFIVRFFQPDLFDETTRTE